MTLLTIWHICHILNIEPNWRLQWINLRLNSILKIMVKNRQKILGIINVLEEKGNQLREPYSKHLDDGIFEIRGKVGTDITRVLYFFYYEKKIIITNGFIKKTQKTPKREIELAKSYRKDYLERMNGNE